jgi:hypothetical protein
MPEVNNWVQLLILPYQNDLAVVVKVKSQENTVDVVTIPQFSYSKSSGKHKCAI